MLVGGLEKEADILEVIANLSNDEVFTPPAVARSVLDLLPAEVWTNPELRWLDPGCKTGVFLREITRRLMVGLTEVIPDEAARLEYILKNQVFGIAITELTALMSRRSVYLSKDAHGDKSIVSMPKGAGNLWFNKVEHAYENGRCLECGASQEKMEKPAQENYAYGFIHQTGRAAIAEEMDMEFDVIVGNPPYQMEADAVGKNVVSIYDRFVTQAVALNPQYISMIMPSRWMVGGRGLGEFRELMLAGARVSHLVDYPNSAELFPTVDIKSGVCYFLWERDHVGTCVVTTHRSGQTYGPVERDLDEFDVLVRDGRALPILRRVLAAAEPALSEAISVRDPFGPTLGSNYRGYRKTKEPGDVRFVLNQETSGSSIWVKRSDATRNLELIDKWKVFLPKAGPGNSGGHIIPDVVISRGAVAEPGSVCSATYLAVGPLASKAEGESLCSFLRTRFARFLVSLRKPSQNTTRETYAWVPQQTWDREWTDSELYAKYGITEDEQAYIAAMIREMD